jgi:hypothetical protein
MNVWKYQLGDDVTIELPEGAKILHVGMQGIYICLWCLVDPHAPRVERRFKVFGTGEYIDAGEYIGTVMEGPYVWHVFEVHNGS